MNDSRSSTQLAATRAALRMALLPTEHPASAGAGQPFPRSTVMKWLVHRRHPLFKSISPLLAAYLLPRLGLRRLPRVASTILSLARPMLNAQALRAVAAFLLRRKEARSR